MQTEMISDYRRLRDHQIRVMNRRVKDREELAKIFAEMQARIDQLEDRIKELENSGELLTE
jgi:predicted nuclease with TOPRIM domain